MPDRRGGSIAVVGECIDHDRHARGSIALVADFLELLARKLAGAALDRVLDAVGRHVDLTCFLHRKAQPKVAVGVASPSLAEIVISRLARVNACPRLASTMAFLCLMPAHFEWPDTRNDLRTCFR